jgi:hypothetical protein
MSVRLQSGEPYAAGIAKENRVLPLLSPHVSVDLPDVSRSPPCAMCLNVQASRSDLGLDRPPPCGNVALAALLNNGSVVGHPWVMASSR